MPREPRRLRNLNFEELDEEPVEEELEDVEENEENLQGPPDIDNILAGLPQKPADPIKIIWPDGRVGQVVGDFRVSNLLQLQGGKVVVGTDENGVPNERSASILGQHLGDTAKSPTFAPLDIPRWDNKLFEPLKVKIIKDTEAKFVFPAEKKKLSRDWILRTVSTRWRAYKSKLKKQYFNPDVRSLDEIINGRPKSVNAHQWRGLVGIWFTETHKKLCGINSRCAKEQKNPHTTGRKSHARLKKEMEDQRKEKIHKIELYDAAHKKKDGEYVNNSVKTIMDTSFVELAKRKEKNNGHLSAKDYAEVFDQVVAAGSTPRGYYNQKYWGEANVSHGLTFVCQSEEELRAQSRAEAAENKLCHMNELLKQWHAMLRQKFPEEDWPNVLEAAGNDDVDTAERVGDNSSQHESSDNVDYDHNGSDRNHEETNANVHSPTHSEQRSCAPMYAATEEDYAQPSLPREHMNAKKKQTESRKQADQGYAIADLPRHSLVMNKGSRRVNPPGPNRSKTGNIEVYLFSLRTKDKVLAKGQLVTTDSRRVILGHMLGSDFFGVHVDGLENLSRGNTGEETLPRPYEQIRTIRDAVGYVIAWPRTHVKKLKSSSQTGKNLDA